MDKKEVKEKGQKAIKLLENEIFNEIIIEDFIKGGIIEQSLVHSLDNEKTIDELKARQILHKYIFGLISYAETVNR